MKIALLKYPKRAAMQASGRACACRPWIRFAKSCTYQGPAPGKRNGHRPIEVKLPRRPGPRPTAENSFLLQPKVDAFFVNHVSVLHVPVG